MSITYVLFDGITLILAALNCVIGVRALLYARNNRQPNFWWLALWFLCVGGMMSVNRFAFTLYPVIVVMTAIATFGIANFIKNTFYQNRRNWYWPVLALSLGILLLTLVFAVQYQVERARISPGDFWAQTQDYDVAGPEYQTAVSIERWITWLVLVGYGVAWLWHLWAGWEAYQAIRTSPQVEDWVKGRYRLVIAYSALYLLPCLTITLRNLTGIQALTLVMPVALIVAVIMQFLAWMMPEGFRRWLNRNYHEEPEEAIVLE